MDVPTIPEELKYVEEIPMRKINLLGKPRANGYARHGSEEEETKATVKKARTFTDSSISSLSPTTRVAKPATTHQSPVNQNKKLV